MTRENIIAARIGDIPVTQAILGLRTVMRTSAVYDQFSRSNRFLDDDGRWVNYGPATNHRAVIENTVVRIGIPDGLTTETEAVSYMRCAMDLAFFDDGYIQCRVFTAGDTAGMTRYETVLFGKVNEDFTEGVGISMAGSRLSLVVRNDGDDSVQAVFGEYSVNDVIRLSFSGKDYTVYCNNQRRGSWNDLLNQVESGESHRSLGIKVEGMCEANGSRRFSPALDFVEYG